MMFFKTLEWLRQRATDAWDIVLGLKGEDRPSPPISTSSSYVERFAFSVSKEITLGTPCRVDMADSPDVTIRPEAIIANISWPGFLIVDDILIANVSVLAGGSIDAFNLRWKMINSPTLTPANRMSVYARYTGLVPNELRAHVVTNGDVLAFRQEINRLRRALTDCRQAHWTCAIKQIARAALAIDWEPRVEVRTPPTFNVCVTASGPASMIT